MAELGLEPAAVSGHSLGEFMAAHIAGVFNLEDALKLVVARAKMMQALPAGKMLAVKITREKLESILPEKLSIAAINSKDVIVASGETKAIASFTDTLSALEIPNRLLENNQAFHSAMMEPVLEPFEAVVKTIILHPPKIPLVSTVTGKWMTPEEATDPTYWSAHIRKTVLFTTAMDTLLDRHNFLVNIGPGNALAPLLRKQCIDQNATFASAYALTHKNGSVFSGMLYVLGQLWAQGFKPDWKGFYQAQNQKKSICRLTPTITKSAGQSLLLLQKSI